MGGPGFANEIRMEAAKNDNVFIDSPGYADSKLPVLDYTHLRSLFSTEGEHLIDSEPLWQVMRYKNDRHMTSKPIHR